jgi:hypothetical protein
MSHLDPYRYYVYAYLRSTDSVNGAKYSPYYIGKGSGKRLLSTQGRPANKPRDRSMAVYIQEGLTEEQAFSLERYCIALYGRIDIETGCLRNKSDGGEGASGVITSDAKRRKISLAHKGKVITEATRLKIGLSSKGRKASAETRQKMSEATKGERNPFFGKKHSEEFKSKRSAAMSLYRYELTSPTGEIYTTCSVTLFAKQHGLRQGCLAMVVSGKRLSHKGWTGRILEVLNDKTDVQ